MKKNNQRSQRSKSFTAKNSGTSSSATNSNSRPKLNKRNSSTPVGSQKLRSETVSTPTSDVVEKEKSFRRKRGTAKKEEISKEVDQVIDLSRPEDVQKMMIQLMDMLGIRNLPTNEQGSSVLETENYFNEIALDRRKFATITKPDMTQITDCNSAKTMPVCSSKRLLEGFSESKRQAVLCSQQNRVKLPNIKDHGRQLFQVLYSTPTDLNKLQKSQQRPRSLSRITNRGMDFANERYRTGCASRGHESDILYRSRTCQTYPNPYTGGRSNPSRGTVVYRSILSRGKPKTERLSRVTFVDEQYDSLQNDSRGKQGQILQVF